MKILFLHLSDIHIKNDTILDDLNIDCINKALIQCDDFDELFFIVSGDISYSGKASEYSVAGHFIEELSQRIVAYYNLDMHNIHYFFVPGNHDVDFDDINLKRINVNKFHNKRSDSSSIFNNYTLAQKNYIDFARKYNCEINNYGISSKIISIDGLCFKINLINTAPFSLKGGDNIDKGYHYLEGESINKLSNNYGANFVLTVMHHNNEWFKQDIVNILYESLFKYSNVVFSGHDHNEIVEERNVDSNQCLFSRGGSLHSEDKDSSFNVVMFDTETNLVSIKKFIFNGSIYKPVYDSIITTVVQPNSVHSFSRSNEFLKNLNNDTNLHDGQNINDYFTFPVLQDNSPMGKKKASVVADVDSFYKLVKDNNYIHVKGEHKAGKTTLSKYLCNELYSNYVPVLLNELNFEKKKPENILKAAFNFQYDSSNDYDEFLQFDKSSKIIIIDGRSLINDGQYEEFINYCSRYIGKYIIFYDSEHELDIAKNAFEDLKSDSVVSYSIRPFYYSQRIELIKKACKVRNIDSSSINNLSKEINDSINHEIGHFKLTPEFILLYVDYYIFDSEPRIQRSKQSIFNRVFEFSIIKRLKNNSTNFDYEEIFEYLLSVAWYMYKNGEPYVDTKTLSEIINRCNKEKALHLDTIAILDLLKSSVILKSDSSNGFVSFVDESYLSYFIALFIHRIDDLDEKERNIKFLLENLCFKICREVILFYSYIAWDISILNSIINETKDLVEDWEELDFVNNNIKFLNGSGSINKGMKLPTKEDKRKFVAKKTDTEKEIIESNSNSYKNSLNIDVKKNNSFENKILKVIYYLDIIAKMLPSFRTSFKAEKKDEIIMMLYKVPNKVLWYMFSALADDFDIISEEIQNKCSSLKMEKEINKEIIEKAFQKQSIICICSIFNVVSISAAVGKGMEELNTFNFDENLNYQLLNLIMESNGKNIQDFIKKAIKMYPEVKDSVYFDVCAITVLRFVYENDINFSGKSQKMIDIYFKQNGKNSKSVKKDLFLEVKKSKSIS